MKKKLIAEIEQQMLKVIDNSQLEILHHTLCVYLANYEIAEKDNAQESVVDYVEMFLSAKRIEGCSEKSLAYYQKTIVKMLETVGKTAKHITTDDLRN